MRRSGLRAVGAALLLTVAALQGCGREDPVEVAPEPRAHVWGEPAGAAAGKPPSGVVILVHGGGWAPNQAAYEAQIDVMPFYQRAGYATLAIEYGPGADGLRDLEYFFERARRRYPGTPICAIGASAGGHLALMLATREPDLACVVDLAGPGDLTSLAGQGAAEANRLAVNAFGAAELETFSPLEDADRIEAEVLLVFAATDPIVPVEQAEQLVAALPDAELIVLPVGEAPFIHGPGVDPAAKQRAGAAQLAFLARATGAQPSS